MSHIAFSRDTDCWLRGLPSPDETIAGSFGKVIHIQQKTVFYF